jgi:hypothetical protein
VTRRAIGVGVLVVGRALGLPSGLPVLLAGRRSPVKVVILGLRAGVLLEALAGLGLIGEAAS